jgi:nitrogen fixation protein NifU and related proteins
LVTDETAEAPRTLGDLRMMQGVRKFPQRVKCAMLAWRAVEQALLQSAGEATISTETDFAVPRHRGLPDSAAPIGKNAA